MNIDKRLLVDVIPFEVSREMLNESIRGGGPLRVEGVLQRANAKNQNGRVYPKDILMREAQKYQENLVRDRRAVGELDHPESPIINLKNVSHNVVDLKWVGDDLVGTVEILNTPSGNILRDLFAAGIKLGISSRSMGSTKKNLREGTLEVQDDLELICFDFVSNPSTVGAFMTPMGQLNEGFDRNNVIIPHVKYDKVDGLVREILSEMIKD